MKFLVVTATARKGRKSVLAAEHVTEVFREEGHEAELFDIKEKDIPMLETRRYTGEGEVPEDIEEFGREVEDSDALVIVTPEYNHSIPGALKSLLDHLYPEYEDMLFTYVTVSAGGFGGVRAMSHLHDITLAFSARPGPSIQVSNINDLFEDRKLVDEDYRKRFREFVSEVIGDLQ